MSNLRIDGLNLHVVKRCEEEFQKRMTLSDGEYFWFFEDTLGVISLIRPCARGQVALGYFARCGCPISCLRFGESLYLSDGCKWPVKDEAASIHYILKGLEILTNLQFDRYFKKTLKMYSCSLEFRRLMHLCDHIVSNKALSHSICPEIVLFVRNNVTSSSKRLH